MIYSNLWIALAALSMTWQTQLLLSNHFELSFLTAFIFFSTFLLYAVHRLVSLQKLKAIDQQARFFTIQLFRPLLLLTGFVSFIIVSFLYFKLDERLRTSLLMPIVFAAGYALPILPGRKRLRDIRFVKNILIAGVWTWVTVMLPILEWQLPLNQSLVLMSAGRFSFIFGLSLAFDIRDVKLDQDADLKTIPVALGIVITKKIAIILLFFAFLCVVMNWFLGFYELNDAIGISISLFITGFLVAKASPEKNDFYFSALLDGVMILQFLLVWVL